MLTYKSKRRTRTQPWQGCILTIELHLHNSQFYLMDFVCRVRPAHMREFLYTKLWSENVWLIVSEILHTFVPLLNEFFSVDITLTQKKGFEPPPNSFVDCYSIQLSYFCMVELDGLEPSTSCVQGKCTPNCAITP